MRGAAGKRYSEGMKSLEFKLKETAPLTCKIWFTCNGQLKCTREANATVPAIQPPPVGSHALKMAKKKIHTGRASDIKYQQRNIASHTKAKRPQRSRNERGAQKRLQEGKDKEKSCQRDLQDAKDEMLHLGKQIQEMKTAIEFLNKQIARNEYFLQEPEAAVTEFSKDEIEESKKCLGNTLIGEGRSSGSSVYKGLLHNTTFVAIKMLHRESMQGESDFNRKVGVLGRVRHPNIVTLIGVCREEFGLVYEFLPNRSLQDQLVVCRNGRMSPLKWQVRFKIIRKIWTVLTFLHLSKPPLVHGNLKASKVLLDSKFTCKVEAFGISQTNGIGKPTTQHDVHSFGIIILQLLTGLLHPDPENIVKVLEEAVQKGKLDTVLDPAGNWPITLAKQLADIGLRCVEMSREERPDLVGDVWKELKSHNKNVGSILTSGQDDDDGPPKYFICPITLDVMENPYFAADGHTYEYVAILKWIYGDQGKADMKVVLSPMTNLELKSFELIPNLALRSEIKEWKEKQRQKQQARNLVCDPHPPVPIQSETSRIRGKLKHE